MNVGKGVEVMVGVGDCSRVGVRVTVGVGCGPVTWPELRRIKKIKPAPTARMIRIKPIANGKLNVTSGKRWLRIGLEEEGVCLAVKVRPQTRHRVAFSLNRVPQVGHTFVDEMVSGLIFLFDLNYLILQTTKYYNIGNC